MICTAVDSSTHKVLEFDDIKKLLEDAKDTVTGALGEYSLSEYREEKDSSNHVSSSSGPTKDLLAATISLATILFLVVVASVVLLKRPDLLQKIFPRRRTGKTPDAEKQTSMSLEDDISSDTPSSRRGLVRTQSDRHSIREPEERTFSNMETVPKLQPVLYSSQRDSFQRNEGYLLSSEHTNQAFSTEDETKDVSSPTKDTHYWQPSLNRLEDEQTGNYDIQNGAQLHQGLQLTYGDIGESEDVELEMTEVLPENKDGSFETETETEIPETDYEEVLGNAGSTPRPKMKRSVRFETNEVDKDVVDSQTLMENEDTDSGDENEPQDDNRSESEEEEEEEIPVTKSVKFNDVPEVIKL